MEVGSIKYAGHRYSASSLTSAKISYIVYASTINISQTIKWYTHFWKDVVVHQYITY